MSASVGAERYEIQIDDSCDPTSFRSCSFPSPEIAAEIAGATSFQPASDLPVELVPPVGRRYFWRLRACNASGCSPYTEVRYVDVGRVPGDVNGDGYPDLLAGSFAGGGYVYHGGPDSLSTTPSGAVIPATHVQFDELLPVGDLNADGFADVCARDPLANHFSGNAHIYYGGPAGLPAQPSLTIPDPRHAADSFFALWCFGPGDVDGDGYADLLVAEPGIGDMESVLLFEGGPTGISPQFSLEIANPSTNRLEGDFGFSGVGLGDINGDGYADFAIGDEAEPLHTLLGVVYIYHGSPVGPATEPDQQIVNSVHPTRIFFGGNLAGGRDLDGDGFADVVIGPLAGRVGTPYPNAIYAYHGSPEGLVDPPLETIFSPRTNNTGWADQFSLGDANGDGQVDLITGDTLYQPGDEQGAVELFLGAAGRLGPGRDQLLPNPTAQPSGLFGNQVALCDLDSDGYDERVGAAVRQDRQSAGDGAVYVFAGSANPTEVATWILDNPTGSAGGAYGRVVSCGL